MTCVEDNHRSKSSVAREEKRDGDSVAKESSEALGFTAGGKGRSKRHGI